MAVIRHYRAAAPRAPLTATAIAAALISGAILLLAACSSGGNQNGTSAAPAAHGAAVPATGGGPDAPAAAGNSGDEGPGGAVPGPASTGAGTPATPPAQLAASGASIVYTASLTVRAKNVTSAAAAATRIATGDGGYVSSENASVNPGGHALPQISLQLKIPAAEYPGALQALSAGLGTQVSLTQQAQDVTEQVADTNSRVASAQAAITQLRALLARAGSVPDLLTVQDQITSEESTLEELEADQRALSNETSYATVSLTLLSPARARTVVRQSGKQHGFLAGLASGWRGLRATVSAVLTAIGTVLPFAAVIALLSGAGLLAWRLRGRRRSRPTAAG
jgi:hypothetical protein